jgi:hypothetical protein
VNHLKSSDRTGTSSGKSHDYVLFLDQTQIPEFKDMNHKSVPFTAEDIECWLRRLRILYQIDKDHNYADIIFYILSILQFVPASLLIPLVRITMASYSIDEMILNDIARARMYMLEEWTTDGHRCRAVRLSDLYQTMSPQAIAIARQTSMENKINRIDDEKDLLSNAFSNIDIS